MKKFLSIALLVCMCLGLLAGCGSDAAAETTAAAPAEGYAEDVQAIIDRGVLRVGVKNAVEGFGFQDTLTGEYSGMEIDLANMIAEYLGVDVEFTTVTAATRSELLDSGDIDCVLATFTITEERKQSWDFTTPYYTDHVTVLVEKDSGITSLADLEGAVIGVSSGSTVGSFVLHALMVSSASTSIRASTVFFIRFKSLHH